MEKAKVLTNSECKQLNIDCLTNAEYKQLTETCGNHHVIAWCPNCHSPWYLCEMKETSLNDQSCPECHRPLSDVLRNHMSECEIYLNQIN